MRVVEAPFHAHIGPHDVSVFIGGGITDCPDWQTELIAKIRRRRGAEKIVLLNPRREKFNVKDMFATVEQIQWEFDYLKIAKIRVFWFPEESICPITLFELGKELMRSTIGLVIGCHPKYSRLIDLEIQCGFHFKNVIIGWDEFASEVVNSLSWSPNSKNEE